MQCNLFNEIIIYYNLFVKLNISEDSQILTYDTTTVIFKGRSPFLQTATMISYSKIHVIEQIESFRLVVRALAGHTKKYPLNKSTFIFFIIR